MQYLQSTLSIPFQLLQLAVVTAVLHHRRPLKPVRRIWICKSFLRGYCTPNQKLARFVLCVSKLLTPFGNMIYASHSKLSKELKNSIKI